MAAKDTIVVAIELGTSRISGVAGKMKDGTMRILAYAEEPIVPNVIKRGIVYNIEKTTQIIKNVVAKLQMSLKLRVSQVYVGIGGQSVRSVKNKQRMNMMTQTYITADHVDRLRNCSYDVPVAECELLENFPQGFLVDSNPVDDPVGVMGTNIEGEYLNVIARKQLEGNLRTCFSNADIHIAETKLSAYEQARNVLTEQEKRAGSVLVDLGAGTTTVVVYKNNILRHLATLPIGFSNITEDLRSALDIDEKEAEELKQKYGNAFLEEEEVGTDDPATKFYTTSFDQKIEIATIQNYIDARLTEIIANVENQIFKSNYENQLLGGVVLTGGGANMKNIEKAFAKKLKLEKVRVAKSIIPQVIKNSGVTNLVLDSGRANSILSLLLSGEENCVGEDTYSGDDIFDEKKKEEDLEEKKRKAQENEKIEAELSAKLEDYKNKMREGILRLENKAAEVTNDDKNKTLRRRAGLMADEARILLGADYESCVHRLEQSEKNRQRIKEASDLSEKYQAAIDKLYNAVEEAQRANSWLTKVKATLGDLVNGD